MTIRELCEKEVVQLEQGVCLGRADDLELDPATAQLQSLILLGRPRLFGLLGRDESLTMEERGEAVSEMERLAESGVELIIRTPVVPNFNDTPEEIRAISKFAASLRGVKEHHLLPYHRLGQDKYSGLGRRYSLEGVEPPSKEKMEYLKACAEECGLKCQIGG